jgi:GrpB-like predicted nucleotidyltransferase (UPF0157 family)
MKLKPFDESETHREIRPYDGVYPEVFRILREYIEQRVDTVELFHIGSTAIPDLRGKPMVDIAAVSRHADLRREQARLEQLGFHRRAVWVDRDDKPYVCASIEVAGATYNININICRKNDLVHRDSLEFAEILNDRPDLRRKYEAAKDRAHSVAPTDAETYNREKASVIEEIHRAHASRIGKNG